MLSNITEIEGSSEQVIAHAMRYKTHSMRLTILPQPKATSCTSATAPVSNLPVFASAWEYLQSLPKLDRTKAEWEQMEHEFQQDKDSWGD